MRTLNQYFSIEIDPETEAPALRDFLVKHGFKFETSGAWNMTHFEIFVKNDYDYNLLDEFIYNDLEG